MGRLGVNGLGGMASPAMSFIRSVRPDHSVEDLCCLWKRVSTDDESSHRLDHEMSYDMLDSTGLVFLHPFEMLMHCLF